MDKIKWCLKQNKGIRLIKPNEDIGKEYFKEAESDLKDLPNISLKWKNIVGYYACYNALYAVLQKIGVKCEIHDCTIELIGLVSGYSDENKDLITKLKDNRINVQYYLGQPKQMDEKKIAEFIIESRLIFNSLTFDDIKKIRDALNNQCCKA